MNIHRTLIIMGVIAGLAGLPLWGCGGEVAEKAAEIAVETAAGASGAEVDINTQDQTVSITDKDGTKTTIATSDKGEEVTMTTGGETVKMTSGDNAKIPDTFPKDMPQYKGAKLVTITEATENQMFTVQWKTPGEAAKVAEALKKDAAAHGWTEGMIFSAPGEQETHMLNFDKGERTLSITIAKDSEETMILLTTANK